MVSQLTRYSFLVSQRFYTESQIFHLSNYFLLKTPIVTVFFKISLIESAFGITPNKHAVCLLFSSDDLKKRPVRARLADIDHITFVKWAKRCFDKSDVQISFSIDLFIEVVEFALTPANVQTSCFFFSISNFSFLSLAPCCEY